MTLIVCELRADDLQVGEQIEVSCWEEAWEVAEDMVARLYDREGHEYAADDHKHMNDVREDIQAHNRHVLWQVTEPGEEFDWSKAIAVQIVGFSDT